jgi:hypothetical protein
MPLSARPVDPRDVTIEESEPTYRAYFWADGGGRCREYDLTGVDAVDEVIDWCDDNVGAGETYILGVLWQDPVGPSSSERRSVAFIRLKGDPPPGHSVGTRVE